MLSEVNIELIELKGLKLCNFPGYEILVPIEGIYKVEIKEKCMILRPGDLFILNPHEIALFIPDQMDGFLLRLRVGTGFKYSHSLLPFLTFNNLLMDRTAREKIIEWLFEIYENYHGKRDSKLIYYYINKIFDQLIKRDLEKENDIINFEDKIGIVNKALEFLEGMEFDDISLDSISKKVFLSQANFSRIFKEVTGIGFVDYKQKKILYESSKILQKTSMTIEDITYETGFKSIKSLNRVYNKYINMTPSQYRKEYGVSNIPLYSEKELKESQTYKDFIKKYRSISYEDYYNKEGIISTYSLDANNIIETIDKKIFEIYDLDTLGYNYVDNFRRISGNISIGFLVLKLTLLEDLDRVYLDDLKISISLYELLLFLEELRYKKTKVGIQVNVYNVDKTKLLKDDKARGSYIRRLDDFYTKLINLLIKSRANKIDWIIDLSDLVDDKMNQRIDYIMEYIDIRKNIIEKKLGKNYIYSFYLGTHKIKTLKEAQVFYDNNKISEQYPNRVYFGIVNTDKIRLEDTSAYELLFRRYRENLFKMERKNARTIIGESELVIAEISSEAEVEFCDSRYMDLTLSYIILDIITKLEIQVHELMSVKLNNEIDKDKVNKTLLIGKEGFLTPIYYVMEFLSKMGGDVLSRKEGLIVTRKGEDINVLVYGNLMLDYKYASIINFDNLERNMRTVSYEIANMTGRYKVIKNKLSLRYGETEFYLNDFENRKYLNPSEREYIESVSRPRRKVQFIEADGKIEDQVFLEPYSIIFTRYLQI